MRVQRSRTSRFPVVPAELLKSCAGSTGERGAPIKGSEFLIFCGDQGVGVVDFLSGWQGANPMKRGMLTLDQQL